MFLLGNNKEQFTTAVPSVSVALCKLEVAKCIQLLGDGGGHWAVALQAEARYMK